MKPTYTIRQATHQDAFFIATTILEAEKSNTDRSYYTNLFGLSEAVVHKLFIQVLLQDKEPCAFDLNSFLIVEVNRQPAAALGGWIEDLHISSDALVEELIAHAYPLESLDTFVKNVSMLAEEEEGLERRKGTLQLEYLYVNSDFRRRGFAKALIEAHISAALRKEPNLKQVEVQLYDTSLARGAFEKLGFQVKAEEVETSPHRRVFAK